MDTELYENVVKGNVQEVQRLIKQNKSLLQKRWKDGRTLLHVAAQKNHDHIIQLLVETYHMDVNACDIHGATPLFYASEYQCLRALGALLKHKDIDIEKKDTQEHTILHRVAYYDFRKSMLLLLNAGSNCNTTDIDGSTPLHTASYKGHLEIVKILLQQEAIKIDATDKQKRTPLHLASSEGHTEVALLLLNAGSNCNAINAHHWTPLHKASHWGKLEIVKILLQQKTIQIDATTNNKKSTPLHLAAHNAQEPIVRCLLQAGANVDVQDVNGKTPLHHAALKGHKTTAQCLLEAGAAPTLRDNRGNTPLDLLPDPKDPELSALLTTETGVESALKIKSSASLRP